jgi:O-antigen/teichoic acid export membrane protein
LVASDAFLQGCRYAFIAYLGYLSFSLLGSYLFGSAIGALAAVAIDFGINQHWLRLESGPRGLTRQAFTRVLAAKLGLSFIQILAFVLLIQGGIWTRSFPTMMVTGLIMANLHAFVDTCEAVGFIRHRYRLVALVRVVLGMVMYAAPVCVVLLAGGTSRETAIQTALQTGIFGGTLILLGYIWKTSRMLTALPESGEGYLSAWRASRWLGLNQLAIVVDVRAPLVLLGLLLGETAVGLYGFVQRTTAVVELAWASLSKLLLKSYAEEASARGGRVLHRQVVRASWITGLVMVVGIAGMWVGSWYVEELGGWSQDIQTSLALLRWAAVAIGLSSLKRPLVLGLIALHHERDVCTVNLLSATTGLISVPFLIWSLGIWGPIVAAVVLEAGAILLLVSYFRAAHRGLEAGLDEQVSTREGHWVSQATAGSGRYL